jgi:hypothetical protein
MGDALPSLTHLIGCIVGSICEDVVAEFLLRALLVGSASDLGFRSGATAFPATVASSALSASSMVVTSSTHIKDERWTLDELNLARKLVGVRTLDVSVRALKGSTTLLMYLLESESSDDKMII